MIDPQHGSARQRASNALGTAKPGPASQFGQSNRRYAAYDCDSYGDGRGGRRPRHKGTVVLLHGRQCSGKMLTGHRFLPTRSWSPIWRTPGVANAGRVQKAMCVRVGIACGTHEFRETVVRQVARVPHHRCEPRSSKLVPGRKALCVGRSIVCDEIGMKLENCFSRPTRVLNGHSL